MEIAIIFLGLILLIFLVFRGVSIYIATPICSILVAILSGVDFFQAYMTTYMEGMVGFAKTYLPMFMLGAIFGKVMEDSGASKSIALFIVGKLGKGKALLSIVLAGAVLTYGGVSMFVASFALYPLALAIFREANISRRLIPATIQAGTFTFTMVALPGSPAIQNIIPTNYFGTTAMAAPVLGIIAAIMMFGLSMLWLGHAKKRYEKKGLFFDEQPGKELPSENAENLPHPLISLIPLLTVLVSYNVLPVLLPVGDFVKANMIIPALLLGNIVGILLNLKYLRPLKTLNDGATNSIIPTLNTSAIVGFGAVIKAVPAFAALTDAIFSVNISNPLIAEAIAIYVITAATGSSSGGLTIAMDAMSSKFIDLSQTTGISLQTFHRVAAVSSAAFDSLPHNGGVLVLLDLSGYGYKQIYFDMFMVTVIIPLLTSFVMVFLGGLGVV